MALSVPAPPAPGRRPTGTPDTVPLRSPASPLTQGLAVGSVIVATAAVAVAVRSTPVLVLPTVALLAGVGLGLGLDLRSAFRTFTGVAWSMATMVGLAALWIVLAVNGGMGDGETFALVPLAGLFVLGLDWSWAERVRGVALVSGIALVPGLAQDLDSGLPIAVAWFATVAGTLWSARRDVHAALPQPRPVPGLAAAGPATAVPAVIGLVAAWVAAAAVVALASLVLFRPDPPTPPQTIGVDLDGDGIPDVTSYDLGSDQGGGSRGWQIDPDGRGGGVGGQGGTGGGQTGGGTTGTAPGAGQDDSGTGSGGGPGSGGTAQLVDEDDAVDTALLARRLAVGVGVLVLVALAVVLVRALLAQLARRRALKARPWAVQLAERLEVEGRRRGRARHRSEPLTIYATALGDGVLPDPRLDEVGRAVSAALFSPGGVTDGVGAWAGQVVDEAVAAHPVDRWWNRSLSPARGARPTRGSAA